MTTILIVFNIVIMTCIFWWNLYIGGHYRLLLKLQHFAFLLQLSQSTQIDNIRGGHLTITIISKIQNSLSYDVGIVNARNLCFRSSFSACCNSLDTREMPSFWDPSDLAWASVLTATSRSFDSCFTCTNSKHSLLFTFLIRIYTTIQIDCDTWTNILLRLMRKNLHWTLILLYFWFLLLFLWIQHTKITHLFLGCE